MVELIPRRKKKITKKQKYLLYFLVFLVISLTVTYIVLVSFKNNAQAELQEIEEKIANQKSSELSDLETKVKKYKIKIDEYAPYLNSHILATKFFEFLEDNTHPYIYFSQISLRLDSNQVTLAGQANSFLSLGQQLIIFEKNSKVKSISLSNISLGETGNILFNLKMSLDKSLFRY